MLKGVFLGLSAGVGFVAGEYEIFDPTDVSISEHREVRFAEYYTVSGRLSFENRTKYEDVTVLVRVFQDSEFVLECSEYLFMEENTDFFDVECDILVSNLPKGISYTVKVSKATPADE